MSATAPDYSDEPGEVKTLLVEGQPAANDSVQVEIEAQRDIHIIGWTTGDTSSLDKTFHQWVSCWLGGSEPDAYSSGFDIGYADDDGYLFEFDMTFESDGTGYAAMDNDGVTTMFPEGYHVPWNEGVTLNVRMTNTTDQGDSDAMDIVFYYVVADEDGAGPALA